MRSEIATLYRDYTVFFAALFAQVADRNYQSRVDAIDGAVEDLALLEEIIKQLAAGKITNAQAMEEIMHVERDDLRERLQTMLSRKTVSPAEKQKLMSTLGLIQNALDKEKKNIETSHMHYATGQLAVYEEAKETIKRLNSMGMNLAGKFVENAMQQSAGKGKGRGA
jgi:anion-transporting  ArsA/GET3 family ATPase